MRCWVGKEVEHNLNYPNITLFVDCTDIDLKELCLIIKEFQTKLNFTSIYFGANEHDVNSIKGTRKQFKILDKYFKVIEVSENNIISVDKLPINFDNVVIRKYLNMNNMNNITFKIRTPKTVQLIDFRSMQETDLDNLNEDGTFENTDVIIYDSDNKNLLRR